MSNKIVFSCGFPFLPTELDKKYTGISTLYENSGFHHDIYACQSVCGVWESLPSPSLRHTPLPVCRISSHFFVSLQRLAICSGSHEAMNSGNSRTAFPIRQSGFFPFRNQTRPAASSIIASIYSRSPLPAEAHCQHTATHFPSRFPALCTGAQAPAVQSKPPV